MKNLISLLSIILFAVGAYAQTATTATTTAVSTILGPRNVIKTNIAGIALTSMNIYYEYKVGQNISVGTGFGYKLPQVLPVSGGVDNLSSSDDSLTWKGDIEPKGLYVNPYVRYYPKGAITGFYIEAFMRYYNYTFTAPYDYKQNGLIINEDADGEANGFGGGLLIGNQFALGPTFVLDIYAGMGLATGSVHIQTPKDSQIEDFNEVKEAIEENANASTVIDIPFYGNMVDAIKADANSTSAWADIENVPFPIFRFGFVFGVGF